MTSRGQMVQLPDEFRLEGSEVFVRRNPKTGEVVLSSKPHSWDGLFALYDKGGVPGDYMAPADRDRRPHNRDPFKEP